MYTLRDLQEMNSFDKTASFNEEEMQKVAFDMGVEYGLEKEAGAPVNLTKAQRIMRRVHNARRGLGGAYAGGVVGASIGALMGEEEQIPRNIILGAISGGILGHGANRLHDKAMAVANASRAAKNLSPTIRPLALDNLPYLFN